MKSHGINSWLFLFTLYMKRFALFLILIFMTAGLLSAQQIQNDPYFAVSTHPITVMSIGSYPDSLVLVLSIENQLANGYFCVNRKVYAENLKTKNRTYMLSERGLPYCPEVYHFKWKGEQKIFYLVFPSLGKDVRYVNVVEDCKDQCFELFGLVLDPKMNAEINRAYDAYKIGNTSEALNLFEHVIQTYPDYPYGTFVDHVIKILLEQGQYKEAGKWYKKLQFSSFLDKKPLLIQVRSYEGFDRIPQN
ncbi:MAG: hypothetical protein JXR71_12155 [Bacteroidales bacterium]|nr:hypothetical protein [Bacteroidales bacterium]